MRLEGAESCISAAQLVERVEQRIDSVPFTSTAEAEVFVDGRVQPVDLNAWLVTLETSDRDGRVFGSRPLLFHGAECSVIDDVVTLFIAVRLYPGSGLDELLPFPSDDAWPRVLDEDPDPEAKDFPPWQPPTDEPPAAELPPDPRRRAAVSRAERVAPWPTGDSVLDVSAAGALGQLPGVSPGASVHITIATALDWPLELGFIALLERRQEAEVISGAAAFSLLLGSAQACPLQPARWLSLCAGAELGQLAVRPSGFDGSPQVAAFEQLAFDALASSVLRLRLLGSLSVHARLTLVAPIARPAYRYQTPDQTRDLFRMSVVAGRAELGIGLKL